MCYFITERTNWTRFSLAFKAKTNTLNLPTFHQRITATKIYDPIQRPMLDYILREKAMCKIPHFNTLSTHDFVLMFHILEVEGTSIVKLWIPRYCTESIDPQTILKVRRIEGFDFEWLK